MKHEQLPKWLDPKSFLEGKKSIKAKLNASKLENLSGLLYSDLAQWLSVDVYFGTASRKRLWLKGRIEGELSYICQRCLLPKVESVSILSGRLWLVDSIEADETNEDDSRILMSDHRVNLHDWVSEEILLSLPLVVRHEGDCTKEPLPTFDVEEDQKPAEQSRFAKLLATKLLN